MANILTPMYLMVDADFTGNGMKFHKYTAYYIMSHDEYSLKVTIFWQ